MKTSRVMYWRVLAAAAAMLAAGALPAHAQTPAAPGGETAAGISDPGLAADLAVPTTENVDPQDALSNAGTLVSQMQDTLRRVVQLQVLAKKKKDVIKLNCVNTKLVQIRGHLAVNDRAMAKLNEAVARNDSPASNHEYSRVQILHQKVLVLGTEAETECIGEDLSYVGKTSVTVEQDPSIPKQDTTQVDVSVDIPRPPASSGLLCPYYRETHPCDGRLPRAAAPALPTVAADVW